MADTIVSFLLENLMQVLVNEAHLLLGVKDEVKSLRDQLDLMRSFLRDSEAVRQEQETVKVLIGKIRSLSYEAEDVINEYVVEAMRVKIKYPNGMKKFLHTFNKPFTQHFSGKDIKEVRKKIEEVYANKDTFGIEFKQVAVEKSPDGSSSGGSASNLDTLRRRRRALNAEEVDVVGFAEERKEFVKRLIGGKDRLTVVSIVGMGGLGKTTIAKDVFNNFAVKKTFEEHCRALVSVSEEYKPKELLLGILKGLGKNTDKMNEMEEEDLGGEVRRRLNQKRFLIVLDDVWKTDVWSDLKAYLPNDENKSRVIITTRFANVGVHADPDPMNPPHFLRFLDDEESWQLFRNKAFHGGTCTQQWEAVGRKMAKECGGLPLAIVVLGGLLSEKRANFNEWERILHRVTSFLASSSERQNLCAQILALSYYDLPRYLKPCFLYVGVFPEDFVIPAKQLIQLWIAEGFVNNPKLASDGGRKLEEIADDYLEELVDRSLIQVVARKSDGRVKSCSVHDLLRDLCISEAEKENLFEFHGSENSSPVVNSRRVAGDSDFFEKIAAASETNESLKLRTILCFKQGDDPGKLLPFYYRYWCNKLKLLRVVSIESLDLLPILVSSLTHLRYLRIGANKITTFPAGLVDLFNLQTLDLRSKFIRDIPLSIWTLENLRHLYCLGQARFPPPPPSKSLKYLQTLSTICPESCTPETMGVGVPNLLKLGIRTSSNYLGNASSPSIVALQHLQTLKLEKFWGLEDRFFPAQFPRSLTKLTFVDTRLEEDIMARLAKLQYLQILKWLPRSYRGKKMVFSTDGYQRLQVLQITNLDLATLVVEQGGLPSLKNLLVHGCRHLRALPEELWSITNLFLIDVQNPTWEIRQKLRDIQKQDRHKISIYPPYPTDLPILTVSRWELFVVNADCPVLVFFRNPDAPSPPSRWYSYICQLSEQYTGKLHFFECLSTNDALSLFWQNGIDYYKETVTVFIKGVKMSQMSGAMDKHTITAFIDKFL